MAEKNQSVKFGWVELMLAIGCLGAIEIITVKFFWEEILFNDSLKLFRSDQVLAKLAIFSIILGLIGFFNYIVGVFTESLRKLKLRNYLAGLFLIGFLIVSYLHASN